MLNVRYDKKIISDIDKAIPMYGKREFQSPTRSTVPLLSWLKHEQPMVDLLLQDMGIPADCNLHLEYTVAPQQGEGVASHTDLMVISGESSVAVEAKWTEPRYETVGEWLKKGSKPRYERVGELLKKGSNLQNRKDVLNGWLGLLQRHAQHTLHLADFSDVIYQMVHRAASACAVGSNPRMAYVVFEPSPDPWTASLQTIHNDLTHLYGLLGHPKGFRFYLVKLLLSQTAAFDAIALLPKGNEATAQQVSAALSGSNRFFSFEKYCMTKVGDKS
jgi:hypothetical protein